MSIVFILYIREEILSVFPSVSILLTKKGVVYAQGNTEQCSSVVPNKL